MGIMLVYLALVSGNNITGQWSQAEVPYPKIILDSKLKIRIILTTNMTTCQWVAKDTKIMIQKIHFKDMKKCR